MSRPPRPGPLALEARLVDVEHELGVARERADLLLRLLRLPSAAQVRLLCELVDVVEQDRLAEEVEAAEKWATENLGCRAKTGRDEHS